MDYDFLYNLKLKDSGFQSKLGSNFSSRYKTTYMAEFKQSLSSAKKPQHIAVKKLSLTGYFPTKGFSSTPCEATMSLNHYQSLDYFKEKLGTPASTPHVKHSKRKSLDFVEDSDLCSKLSFQTLVKATEIVKTDGVKQCTLSYKRQLREFCLEFLSKYKES